MLITLVCMVVLFTISMNAMNKAVTGEGNARMGTVRSMEDQLNLYAIMQSLNVQAGDNKGRYLTPSKVNGTNDTRYDTSANFWSAMVMGRYAAPKHLFSTQDNNLAVDLCPKYDYTAFNPRERILWDPEFKADLDEESWVSWAHMPLCGLRLDRKWVAFSGSTFPLIGSRGPRDGSDDLDSWTYGADGTWQGHMVFSDGHTQWIGTFTPGTGFRGGEDNIFRIDDGDLGGDAVISFTKEMDEQGPILQWD